MTTEARIQLAALVLQTLLGAAGAAAVYADVSSRLAKLEDRTQMLVDAHELVGRPVRLERTKQ